jgi:hypothetical protein
MRESVMERVLQFFFDRHDPADQAWLASDGTGCRRHGGRRRYRHPDRGLPEERRARAGHRVSAKDADDKHRALHIAKAALVRDAATELLNSDLGWPCVP